MLKKSLAEGSTLEIGKTYCFPQGAYVQNISSKGYSTMLGGNVIFRITNIQTAKKWSSRKSAMINQYTVTIEIVDVIHDPALLSHHNSKSLISQKFVDNRVDDETQVHIRYALAVDSKKVLSDLMEG